MHFCQERDGPRTMSSALAAMSRHRLETSKSPSPSQTRSAAKDTASPRWRAKPRRWAAVTSVAGIAAEEAPAGESLVRSNFARICKR
eukprot:scaffold789_cov125-Isochrysis_galbana.AAC.16